LPDTKRAASAGSDHNARGIGPMLWELQRSTDPLFRQAGTHLDEGREAA